MVESTSTTQSPMQSPEQPQAQVRHYSTDPMPKEQMEDAKELVEDVTQASSYKGASSSHEPKSLRDPISQAMKEQEQFQRVMEGLAEQAPDAIVDHAQ